VTRGTCFLGANPSVGNDSHNHPSVDPSPSAADIQLTRQLREAAAPVDIPLLDHVIIGRRGADPLGRGYYSFREAGLL
jgi:DNA repair protein RadC